MTKVDKDFRRQLGGYCMTTAEITYHMPDAKSLLQTFVWQELDLAPRFPELRRFLAFWQRELDGPLHSVRVAHSQLIKPAEFRFRDHEIVLH
ncbi:MAG: usg protein [Pseudomonadota bacterium]